MIRSLIVTFSKQTPAVTRPTVFFKGQVGLGAITRADTSAPLYNGARKHARRCFSVRAARSPGVSDSPQKTNSTCLLQPHLFQTWLITY